MQDRNQDFHQIWRGPVEERTTMTLSIPIEKLRDKSIDGGMIRIHLQKSRDGITLAAVGAASASN